MIVVIRIPINEYRKTFLVVKPMLGQEASIESLQWIINSKETALTIKGRRLNIIGIHKIFTDAGVTVEYNNPAQEIAQEEMSSIGGNGSAGKTHSGRSCKAKNYRARSRSLKNSYKVS